MFKNSQQISAQQYFNNLKVPKLLLWLLSTFLLLVLQSDMGNAAACVGCVDLDELNFDKTIRRFPFALVKFDIAFPYGEKHEAFGAFSASAHRVTDDLLVATVGIKDYGDNENKKLGDRFHVDEKTFPGIFLFKGKSTDYVRFPSYLDVTLTNLKNFVTQHSDLYIGRDGCLKAFEELIKNYANFDDHKQLETIKEIEQLAATLEKLDEQASAKIYLIYMRKINEKGYAFVEDETKRLQRLRASKVTDIKKFELQTKLNILESFRVNKLTKEQPPAAEKQEL